MKKNYISSMFIIFLVLFLLFSSSQQAESSTILVDGVSEWKNPNVHVGDIIIFKHKYNYYKLYIFKNKSAFNLCNFTQATLLSKPNSTSYTWYPSRPGFFYFAFNNGSLKTCNSSQKLSIEVSAISSTPPPIPSPENPPMMAAGSPTPASGGFVSSSPAYPWPFRPREVASSPTPAPLISAATSPVTVPDKGGGGIPFINSNPAVPLPTGEVDSATIRPMPTSASGHVNQLEVGLQLLATQILVLLFSSTFLMML